MALFQSDGIEFNYATRGSGSNTLFFQHGIGGTLAQPFRFLLPSGDEKSVIAGEQGRMQRWRLAAFDFRAHGETPIGEVKKLRFEVFADDLIAFMDHLRVEKAVLGGISMGAAVALNAALRYPERCVALVLSRPAWLDGSMSEAAVAAYAEVVRLLNENPSPETALQELAKSDIYHAIAKQSQDAGKSLLGQVRCVVSNSSLREAVLARMQYLPAGQLGTDLESATAIGVPTLILAAPNDPIHPESFARSLAATISRASYIELKPKQLDDAPHIEEVNTHISEFLELITA
jgi:pimeloyl-ACP methyl ester carboxylesterase